MVSWGRAGTYRRRRVLIEAPRARVEELCDRALSRLGPGPAREGAEGVRTRLREPLRVAVAGRVSAGKSTLVNALLGKQVAPTGAGETTRVVAWFRYGFPERAELELRDGGTRSLELEEGTLPEELGVDPADVRRMSVWLSNEALADMTVIDTPGLASAGERFGEATEALLGLDSHAAVGEADALVYVTTHRARADDAGALASFRSGSGSKLASAMNAVAVLNKADMAAARGDRSLSAAQRVAAEAAGELRALAVDVIPMVSLWAETAQAALTEEDARHLRELAALDPPAREAMLRSVVHFQRVESPVPAERRQRLLELLGAFGTARCLEWIDQGAASAAGLAEELQRSSGIEDLRALLGRTFAVRADALKADIAITALERVTYTEVSGDDAAVLLELRDELDDVRLDPEMHKLGEAWALREAASGAAQLPEALLEDLRRLALAGSVEERLGLDPGAGRETLQRAAGEGAGRWRAFVNSGPSTPTETRIGELICRSYEALWEQIEMGQAATQP